MDGPALIFADATSVHFDAIFRVERESGGHDVIVALEMLGYAVDAVTMERAL